MTMTKTINDQHPSNLGGLDCASIHYTGIGSMESMRLLDIIADIADQCIMSTVRKAATNHFLEKLRSDYKLRLDVFDPEEATICIDLIKLAKYLGVTTEQVKDWLRECGKMNQVIITPPHSITKPMIIVVDVWTKADGTWCSAQIILSALLLSLYRCRHVSNSYARDFLVTDEEFNEQLNKQRQ